MTMFWMITVLILVFPAYKTGRIIASSTYPLTSDLAVEWIKKNVPEGSNIWCQKCTAIPDKSHYNVKELRWQIKKIPRRAFIAPGDGCHFIILRKDARNKLGEGVYSQLILIKSFSKVKNEIVGPDIDIYKVTPDPSRRLLKKERKPFIVDDFPINIDIGDQKNDAEYLSAGWSKTQISKNNESYRIINGIPAKLYFRLSKGLYPKNIKCRLKLSGLKEDTNKHQIIIQAELNGANSLQKEYDPRNNVYIFVFSTENLIFSGNGLNSFEFRAIYNTDSGFIINNEGYKCCPSLKVFNLELILSDSE